MLSGAALDRFLAKFTRGADDECWLWHGAINGQGYGNFVLDASRANRRYRSAHRVSYEHLVGPIPSGLHLDHLCRNRACVNPAHLEPVTNRTNARRGARGDLVTVCKNGHPYDEANTGWKDDLVRGRRRYCRACARQAMARKRAAGYIAPSRRKP